MPPRILIVDDRPEVLKSLRRNIQEREKLRGCHDNVLDASGVQGARTVIELQLSARDPVRIVVTDYDLGHSESGFDVIRAARKIDPSVLAILYTAGEDMRKVEKRKEAYESGAVDIVEIESGKPPDELYRKMLQALQHREVTEEVHSLRRFFDPVWLDYVRTNKDALELNPREVTFAFWDISGFSKFCQTLDAKPRIVANFLKKFQETAAQSVFEHSGVLDRFSGDGFMALFGVLGNDTSEGAVNAADTALAFRLRFKKLTDELTTILKRTIPSEVTLGLRCGMHTGDALVGVLGSEFQQFSAVGHNVNFAARIEPCAKGETLEILVSQTTHHRLQGKFLLEEAMELRDPKNMSGTHKLYRLLGKLE